MTIRRTLDGTDYEIELLPYELMAAYYVQQHLFDVEDIGNWFDLGEDISEYGLSASEVESLYEEMAWELRRNLDKYDMDFAYARDAAIYDILERHRKQPKGV